MTEFNTEKINLDLSIKRMLQKLYHVLKANFFGGSSRLALFKLLCVLHVCRINAERKKKQKKVDVYMTTYSR